MHVWQNPSLESDNQAFLKVRCESGFRQGWCAPFVRHGLVIEIDLPQDG